MWPDRRTIGRRTRWDATGGSPLLLLLIVVLADISGTLGEIDVSIRVPVAVVENSTVKLTCDYNLHSMPLYSVKWYKGGKEFYRFLPKELPPQVSFLPRVKIDMNLSDDHSVVLNNIEANQTGKYKCEVSTDAPKFITKLVWSYMHVVRLPEGNVTVRTEKLRYALGDTVRANCSAPPANPPANITWTVNGHTINSSYIRNTSMNYDNRTMVTAKLELELTSESFVNGRLHITCRANVFQLYRNEATVVVEEERPRLASISMPGGTAKSSTKSWLFALAVVVVIANAR
ncbi:uncharacterized protein LOC106643224 isoform X2 [Copidosoma floridanum]|uniref:uncharacterized protein LOC106643224 isoform X2 n=1 Tax=Copidosoma floridanum TaxID=29053 RepID=UPI0006C98D13|nr:uncharacterized protein LOC106643224 isoform X2 [Copidosoma floridanum]